MKTWVERRIDRSDMLSEALDKLLAAAAKRHELLAAVVADRAGLLVAAARNDAEAERVAAVVGLTASLNDVLEQHDVLDGLSQAVLTDFKGQHLCAWSTKIEDERVFLGLLVKGEAPSDEIATHLVEGVQRIFSAFK